MADVLAPWRYGFAPEKLGYPHTPTSLQSGGVVYTYKLFHTLNGGWTGETEDFRFPMGQAPVEFVCDFGRTLCRRVFTPPGIRIRHA